MPGDFTQKRWSTLTLISVGVALCALGYVAGHCKKLEKGVTKNSGSVEAKPSLGPQAKQSPPPSSPALVEQESHWRQLTSQPRTTVVEKSMLSLIEELAIRDHVYAFALAAAEPNWRLRTLLRNAALRGWASDVPMDAAEFALTLPDHERREAVAALLAGAANHPETSATVAAQICKEDPALAEDHGRALIGALSDVGAFDVMVHFAETDASGHSADLLSAAFYQWAERQPAKAQLALDSLPTSAARQAAFQGLALGWSMANPRELAAYASNLPQGENRTLAMQQALSQWMTRDPESVANWVMRFDPAPEFDLSAATVATTPKLALQQPAMALGWAQSIIEPSLRENTLTTLAQQWASRDRTAAQRLIDQTSGLFPADRSVLIQGLDTVPQPE